MQCMIILPNAGVVFNALVKVVLKTLSNKDGSHPGINISSIFEDNGKT